MRDVTIRLGLALVAFGCSPSDAPVSPGDVDVAAPGEGVLSLTPSAFDFDDVAVGKLEVATVLALNTGDAAVDVAEIVLSGSSDFAIDAIALAQDGACSPDVVPIPLIPPFRVGVGAAVCVSVVYEPGDAGSDTGILSVAGPSRPGASGGELLFAVPLAGLGLDPEITLDTAVVDFGTMAFGESKTLSFTIGNAGNSDLAIESVMVSESAPSIALDLAILTDIAAGTVVAPSVEGGLTVTLRLSPVHRVPEPIGGAFFIEIHSNDRDEPIAYVKLLVTVSPPSLLVTPYPVVDFGEVYADTEGSLRSVTFRNRGANTLTISELHLSGPDWYSFSFDGEFPTDLVIDPDAERTVDLRYENPGSSYERIAKARLEFVVDAADSDYLTGLDLTATQKPPPRCELVLVQGQVDFGVVAFGFASSMTFDVMNIGNAPCSPFSVSVMDEKGSLFPGFQSDQCQVPYLEKSSVFAVLKEPWAIQSILEPGESAAIEVDFMPEESIWAAASADEAVDYRGLLHVTMLDFARPDPLEGTPFTIVTVPHGEPGDVVDCNLGGKGAKTQLSIAPTTLLFGETTVGCQAKVQELVLENPGDTPVRICEVAQGSCNGSVALSGIPSFPPCSGDTGGLELPAGSSITLGVTFTPTTPTATSCEIAFISGEPISPKLAVQVQGDGMSDPTQTDTYLQLSGQDRDVLWVFDDSVSLTLEPEHVAAEIDALAAVASGWASSVHIGVVTTLIHPNYGDPGHLQSAAGTSPRFFSGGAAAMGLADVLGAITHQGGPPDGGLEAARLALRAPLTDAPLQPMYSCTSDLQCAPPYACVPSVLDPGAFRCAGPNWEFFRPNAALELVFFSISEDGSPEDVSDYVDFFKSLKVLSNSGLVRAHAVVGDSGGGCKGPTGLAFAGDRYGEVASALGGKRHSICEPSWASVLKDEPGDTFGLITTIALTRPPLPASITVTVDGAPCESGWAYDAAANAIHVDVARHGPQNSRHP